MKYIIKVNLDVEAPTADKAIESVNEFLVWVLQAGRPLSYTIEDVVIKEPKTLNED